MIHLHVKEDELVERLTGRRVCPNCTATYHMSFNPPKVAGKCDKCGQSEIIQRSDDKEEKIRHRLKVYANQTAPVIRHYENSDQYQQVDGSVEMAAVTASLAKAIEALDASRAS